MRHSNSENRTPGTAALPLDLQVRIDEICEEFLQEQQVGRRPQIEAFLERLPTVARRWLLKELIAEEVEWRRRGGQEVQAQEYFARFEQDQDAVAAAFELGVSAVESTADFRGAEEDSQPATPRRRGADATDLHDWQIPGFEILGEIGRGGMGVVLRARDLELDRDVALKVLRQDKGDASELALRFVEEAHICGQLQHPGIPPVYRLGKLPDGSPFFAMKLIKGRTLADLLDER